MPVDPPEQIPQLSIVAEPPHSPAQSFGAIVMLPMAVSMGSWKMPRFTKRLAVIGYVPAAGEGTESCMQLDVLGKNVQLGLHT